LRIEKLHTDKDKTINVLVIDETPEEWRLWRAFNRVLSRQDDLALKIYAFLQAKGENVLARDVAMKVNSSLHAVRRALNDLLDLELVTRERMRKDNWTLNFWRVNKNISGILRIIPPKYTDES
jgi:DNA-binding transcriptional ArsR family regulator